MSDAFGSIVQMPLVCTSMAMDDGNHIGARTLRVAHAILF